MSETLSIWTIVVAHNAEDVITACLSSLEMSSTRTKVVLVDNGSTDATVELVQRNFPSVIIAIGDNIGFAGGCNRGVLVADDDASAYFFLNPDATVSPTCLELLSGALSGHSQFAIVSPTLRNPLSGNIEYAGASLDLAQLNFDVGDAGEIDSEARLEIVQTGRPTGAAMLVRRSSLDSVGLMDASYFLYWEETEWAWRFIQRGFLIGYVPGAIALHSTSHSTGGRGSKVYEYYYTRNLLRLVAEARHLTKRATLLRLLPFMSRRLWEIAAERKIEKLAIAAYFDFLGALDFLFNRYGARSNLPRGAKRHLTSKE